MPFDPLPDAAQAAAEINAGFAPQDARGVIAHAIAGPGRVALVSSFGAESVVLLHMVAQIDPATPVLFLDTGKLFAETLDYQRRLTALFGLTGLQVIRPDPVELLLRDTDGIRHLADKDGCCALRKVEPLERALSGYDSWISGRKRFHGGQRQALDLAEAEDGRLKLNPLAHWSATEIAAYFEAHTLPRHPLAARGFASIGCAPCTSPVQAGEDPRAGRWRGSDKTECGIHFVNGKVVRG